MKYALVKKVKENITKVNIPSQEFGKSGISSNTYK